MKQYVLSYFEYGTKGECIRHREVFLTRFVAKVNLWFSVRNKRRILNILTEEEV